MNIKRINIKGFGKLENIELELGKGLNIIYGENESGKSTLQMFIKAMLFGLKGGRATSLGIPSEINRFRPWQANDYGGMLEYQLEDGQLFRVERNLDKNTAIIYDSDFNDISCLFDARRDKSPLFAEEHLGLTQECFEKTIFIRQMDVRLDGKENEELLTRLSNISLTGSEDVSFSTTEKLLKDEIKKCLGTERTSSQPIDKLETRLKNLGEERAEVARNRGESLENLQSLRQLQSERAKRQVEKEYLSAVGGLIEEKKDIEDTKGVLTELVRARVEIEDWQRQADRLTQELLTEAPIAMSGGSSRAVSTMLIAAAAGVGIFALLNLWLKNLVFAIAAALLVVAVALFFIKRPRPDENPSDDWKDNPYYKEKLKQMDNVNEQMKDCFSSASLVSGKLISTIEEILAQTTKISLWIDFHKEKLLQDIQDINNKFAGHHLQLDFFQLDNLEQVIHEGNLEWLKDSWRYSLEQINDEIVEIDLGIREYQVLTRSSQEEDDRLQAIDEEMAELLCEKEELQTKGQALSIALETLQDAAEEMRNSYTVELNNKTGNLVHSITGARYYDFRVDDKLRPMTINPESKEVVNALLLSSGTVDQIYLAIRMAATEILMAEKEKLPLLLDEVFAQFDDERTKNMLEYFYHNYPDHQILLFTCKKREIELAQEIYGQDATYII